MAYICLDGLNQFNVNIVGVIGAKKEHSSYENFKQFVLQRNLNFIEYDDLEAPDFIEKIRALNADAAVVCSFNYKIPKILLDSTKDGFINVHPSLLPSYRGSNPYSTVIMNGEKQTGVTLHFMDENFDTGDIIAQQALEISPIETMGTLFNRLNLLGFNMLIEVLKLYENNVLPRKNQPLGEFKKGKLKGKDLFFVDFSKTAVEIERFIRSLNPFLFAVTGFRKNLVKIFSAEIINKKSDAAAGTIVEIDKDKFYIATGNGLISPTAMQFGSFFTGSAKDFINILNPQKGERFSDDG